MLTGTFDVRNYGDLLFPLVAAHRLGPHGISVRPASPTGRETGWRDAVVPAPLVDALFGQDPFDGVLIGGGNIIHAREVNLPDYVEAGAAQWAYGALWQEATLAACQRKVPVVWNAPGVPKAFDPTEHRTLQAVLAAASYVAVRDDASAQFVLPFSAQVVPDTVLGLASLWPRPTLEADFRGLLARKEACGDRPFVAIHVKERSMDGPLEALAALVDDFSLTTGHMPLLIGIGQCHGDQTIAARLAAALTVPCIDLSEPLGLREIAAAIAYSGGYVGASLHGYISAVAYGRAGVIVGRPRLPKMQGLLTQLGREADECPDWRSAFDQMAARISKPGPGVPDAVLSALDRHWTMVATAFTTRSVPDRAQAAFKAFFGAGQIRHEGKRFQAQAS